MASVSDVVGELESAKAQLEAAKSTADDAVGKAEEMIGQAESMELTSAVEGLQALHAQIAALGEQILGVAGGVDELISAAEAIRTATG